MKKILIALLALCMLVCFVACGGNDEPSDDTTAAGGDTPVETTAPAESGKSTETKDTTQVNTDKWTANY